jgi:hypothetical protein
VKFASDGKTIHVLIKLNYVPIAGSIQMVVRGGGGGLFGGIPQNFPGPIRANKNIFQCGLVDYDLVTTSFSIQYVKDSRETNVWQQITMNGTNVFYDGVPIRFE